MDVKLKLEKFQGFWYHGGQNSKFAFSHWLCTWFLPQCSATALPVILNWYTIILWRCALTQIRSSFYGIIKTRTPPPLLDNYLHEKVLAKYIHLVHKKVTKKFFAVTLTRSSADADYRRDAFSGQSRSTNMVPFWVRCDFSLLSMWPAPSVTTEAAEAL